MAVIQPGVREALQGSRQKGIPPMNCVRAEQISVGLAHLCLPWCSRRPRIKAAARETELPSASRKSAGRIETAADEAQGWMEFLWSPLKVMFMGVTFPDQFT